MHFPKGNTRLLLHFEGRQRVGTLGPTLAALEANVGVLRIKDNERRREMFNAAKTVYGCSIIDHPLAHLAAGPEGQRLVHRANLPDKRVLMLHTRSTCVAGDRGRGRPVRQGFLLREAFC